MCANKMILYNIDIRVLLKHDYLFLKQVHLFEALLLADVMNDDDDEMKLKV